MNLPLESANPQPLDEARIDQLGHILRVPLISDGEEGYNAKIEVFKEKDRGQIYQMWAIDRFAPNDVAYESAIEFNLAGETPDKEKWTQLMEHIAGVAAIADHLETLSERYGADPIDKKSILTSALMDNLTKPEAIEAASELMQNTSKVETATLVHDMEKPAELAAARSMAEAAGTPGGLENSRDNPVLREGRLWQYLQTHGVSDEIILAAQNTGRSDRFYGELSEYSDSSVKKALEDRDKLAELLSVDRDVVDAMTPTERRRASIEAKGPAAAIVGISDALAAQFKFRGMAPDNIDNMAAHYTTYKKDSESLDFFGRDWPEYYKQVRLYLIDRVPVENRESFAAHLDGVTHEDIFNETVLPKVLGATAMNKALQLRTLGQPNSYDLLQYPES